MLQWYQGGNTRRDAASATDGSARVTTNAAIKENLYRIKFAPFDREFFNDGAPISPVARQS
jgi:hypothetical protein